jgi:hypothetical protein
MGALEIILLIIVVIEFIVCVAIHFDRKKTHAVYVFMADMVSEEGGTLQKALEEFKDSSTYAQPAESAAALGEITRFLESFNSTVRKHCERLEEAEKHKWHAVITGLLKKKPKTDYKAILKKKPAEKKEPEEEKPETEEKDTDLERIEEKVEKKLEEKEGEPRPKKRKRLKKRMLKPKPTGPKPDEKKGASPESPEPAKEEEKKAEEEKKDSGESDTDIDLAPPADQD